MVGAAEKSARLVKMACKFPRPGIVDAVFFRVFFVSKRRSSGMWLFPSYLLLLAGAFRRRFSQIISVCWFSCSLIWDMGEETCF